MRGLIIGVAVVALFAIGYFVYTQNTADDNKSPAETTADDQTSDSTTGNNTDTDGDQPVDNGSTSPPSPVVITYTDSGFSPSSVEVISGGEVTYVNNGDSQIQIGVDPHPSHTGNKEVSDGEFVLTVPKGEKRTVKLTATGSVGYHDHLNSVDRGTIVVK